MIRDWIHGRRPAVPSAFAPYLDAEDPVSVDGLVAACRRGLKTAADGAGSRAEAFALLAADAYLTWACALTLDEGGEAAELEALVGRVIEGLA